MYIGYKNDRKGLPKWLEDELSKFGEDFEAKAWVTEHFRNIAEVNKQFIVDKSTGGFKQDILLSFIAMHIFSLNSQVYILKKTNTLLLFVIVFLLFLILFKI